MRDFRRLIPEFIDQLDNVWEVSQSIQGWVNEKLEEIGRNTSDEEEQKRQAIAVVYYASCVMHKLFESEEPRMNTQEFHRMLTEKYDL